MVIEINAIVQSFRALTDLVKANKALANSNELVAAVSEVNAGLLSAQAVALTAQEKQSALTERIRELEKENAKLKDWKREKERYQLTEISQGAFVYALKPEVERSEPPHFLCTNCFTKEEKSILQLEGGYEPKYTCPRCNNKVYSGLPGTGI